MLLKLTQKEQFKKYQKLKLWKVVDRITRTASQSSASKSIMPTQTVDASIEIPEEKYKSPEKQQYIVVETDWYKYKCI